MSRLVSPRNIEDGNGAGRALRRRAAGGVRRGPGRRRRRALQRVRGAAPGGRRGRCTPRRLCAVFLAGISLRKRLFLPGRNIEGATVARSTSCSSRAGAPRRWWRPGVSEIDYRLVQAPSGAAEGLTEGRPAGRRRDDDGLRARVLGASGAAAGGGQRPLASAVACMSFTQWSRRCTTARSGTSSPHPTAILKIIAPCTAPVRGEHALRTLWEPGRSCAPST
jgi:hypothetical protein